MNNHLDNETKKYEITDKIFVYSNNKIMEENSKNNTENERN